MIGEAKREIRGETGRGRKEMANLGRTKEGENSTFIELTPD